MRADACVLGARRAFGWDININPSLCMVTDHVVAQGLSLLPFPVNKFLASCWTRVRAVAQHWEMKEGPRALCTATAS